MPEAGENPAGPLLFLLYNNDLAFTCKQTLPGLFADDSNLFLSGENVNYVQQMIKDELKDLLFGQEQKS